MKGQNLKLADNTQQAVKQEISRMSLLFWGPCNTGGKNKQPKTPIFNMSPLTLEKEKNTPNCKTWQKPK